MAAALERVAERELEACCSTIGLLSAALAELASQVDHLPSSSVREQAMQKLVDVSLELQEAFSFIDALEGRVAEASLLVEATDRRLAAFERGERLPESISQLPPAQFSAHHFTRQLLRREASRTLDLPELDALPPAARSGTHAGVPSHASQSPSNGPDRELELERLARAAANDARDAAVSAAATAADHARTAAASAADGARTLFRRLHGEWWSS
ncbi:MAG: hypothetical protein SGPRY_002720 [Prymnesium sp.]